MEKIKLNKNWEVIFENGEVQPIELPFDAMLFESRSPKEASTGSCAFYHGGRYLYRRKLGKLDSNGHYEILFEGIYGETEIYLNHVLLATHHHGYTPIQVELDSYLSEENLLEVKVDNSKQPNSRWYSGSGIYRDVYLLKSKNKAHLDEKKLRIQTLSLSPAKVLFDYPKDAKLIIRVLDGGKLIAESKDDVREIEIPNPKLWDDEMPYRYEYEIALIEKGMIQDVLKGKFGIVQYHLGKDGFFVNGKKKRLKGCCLHHDNGIAGANSLKVVEYRKARLIKEAGFNAIRSSHNPINPILLEACDELGIYVMDEFSDVWFHHKNPFDYASFFLKDYPNDLASMVYRNRNHPSMLFYSLGNELGEPASPAGLEVAKKMIQTIKEIDPIHFVICGLNLKILKENYTPLEINPKTVDSDYLSYSYNPYESYSSSSFNEEIFQYGEQAKLASLGEEAELVSSGIASLLDVVGYNYATPRYESEDSQYPDRLILGSETFTYDIVKNWAYVEAKPTILGDFCWTGIDYLGEVGIGAFTHQEEESSFFKPYPWKLAESGCLDLIGNPTGEAFRHQIVFKNDKKIYLGVSPIEDAPLYRSAWRGSDVIPSYSFFGQEGKPAHVEVFAKGGKVRLYQNEKLIEEKPLIENVASFEITYQPGSLKAEVDSKNGVLSTELHSASGPLHYEASLEDRLGDFAYLKISLVDQDGNIESNRDEMISLDLKGAKLLYFGSAIPKTASRFISNNYETYHGQALALIRLEDETFSVQVKNKGQVYKTKLK